MTAPPRFLIVVAGVMMLLALADMPYGYYQLLRLVSATAAGWMTLERWRAGASGWAIAFGLLALTFNPLLPIHLEREVWAGLNLTGAVLFTVALWLLRSAKPRARSPT